MVIFTFPGETICGVGKTEEDVRRKGKRSRKYIHPYQRQISEKIYQLIFKAVLLQFNCILFKILPKKSIPNPHSGAFNLVVMMDLSDRHWMKISFVYDDDYVIQLQFAFRRSLRNGVPHAWKDKFCIGSFFGEESHWASRHGADSVRFDFPGSSPYLIIIMVVGTSAS